MLSDTFHQNRFKLKSEHVKAPAITHEEIGSPSNLEHSSRIRRGQLTRWDFQAQFRSHPPRLSTVLISNSRIVQLPYRVQDHGHEHRRRLAGRHPLRHLCRFNHDKKSECDVGECVRIKFCYTSCLLFAPCESLPLKKNATSKMHGLW